MNPLALRALPQKGEKFQEVSDILLNEEFFSPFRGDAT